MRKGRGVVRYEKKMKVLENECLQRQGGYEVAGIVKEISAIKEEP